MFHRTPVWLLMLLLTMLAAQATAQDNKPWLRPGTHAGQEIYGPNDGKLVWVPAGEFMMGSDEGPADERPVHRVQISKGFWLGKHEVNISQWLAYCAKAKVLLRDEIISEINHPMSGVSWHDVQAYCRFFGLSLPTEAQWEWAARGPEGRRYPWGNQWDPRRCSNKGTPGADFFTFPVGSFPNGASWCGALDMAGNLAEWCEDWYSETYYAVSPTVDPRGPATGTKKIWRGGYCWGDADECRSASRFASEPDNDGGSGCLRVCYVP